MEMLVRSASATPRTTSPNVVVFDETYRGGRTPLTADQVASSSDAVLRQTVDNASRVMTFLKERFNRDGLDGKGAKLAVVVHATEPSDGSKMNNAYWDGDAGRMFIGDGDGRVFSPLGGAIDVVAHETGHAILESEVNLGFDGQEGALHESFGDVMGSLLDADDWTIGEDVYTPSRPGDSLRDMAHPETYHHMDDLRREPTTEPHALADLPNLVATRVADAIGRDAMGTVWYDGFTTYLRDHGKFTDAAEATITAAQHLYGRDSQQATAVSDAWKSVGILARAPKAA